MPTELLVPKGTSETRNPINLCNDHYRTPGEHLPRQILAHTNETEYSLAGKVCIPNALAESFFLNPTSHEEVEEPIVKLENGKSPTNNTPTALTTFLLNM